MLAVLAMVAGCDGETTAPDTGSTGHLTSTIIPLQISPRSLTIETGQRVQFRGLSASLARGAVANRLEWRASGGDMRSDGSFSSPRPGTFRVFGGRGSRHTDTAVVTVIRPLPGVMRIAIGPHPASIEVGTSYAFSATAFLRNGIPVPVGLQWSSTGGTVDPAGVYTADSVAGTFEVIASNRSGTIADTTSVTVVPAVEGPVLGPQPNPVPAPGPTPGPVPGPTPTPGPGPMPLPTPTPAGMRVIVTPASVKLSAGATQKFYAYGRTAAGDSVSIQAVFLASGGNITAKGLYTAGQRAGSYRVIATVGQRADTSAVSLVSTTPGVPGPTPPPPPIHTGRMGVPVGISGLLSANVGATSGYTMSLDGYSAGNIVSRLQDARRRQIRVLMNPTGGDHDNYKTGGRFDVNKWQARLNTYNTPAIRAAVAQAVADGTIVGASVMDEPQQEDKAGNENKSWGPHGWMTKATVDDLCRRVKQIFPTLPVGVVHDYRKFYPEQNYRTCDFIVSQYRLAKENVSDFRNGAMAFAKRSGITVAFSLNILHGGTPSSHCAKYGDDTSGNLCPMTPEQIRSFGVTLGSAGCALNMWRYEPSYFDQPQVQAAVRAVSDSLARVAHRGCIRT